MNIEKNIVRIAFWAAAAAVMLVVFTVAAFGQSSMSCWTVKNGDDHVSVCQSEDGHKATMRCTDSGCTLITEVEASGQSESLDVPLCRTNTDDGGIYATPKSQAACDRVKSSEARRVVDLCKKGVFSKQYCEDRIKETK